MLVRRETRPSSFGVTNARAVPLSEPELSRGEAPSAGGLRGLQEQLTWPASEPTGIWQWYWLLLVAAYFSSFLAANVLLPRLLPGSLNIYLGQPILWSVLSVLSYVGWRFGPEAHPRGVRLIVGMGALTGFFQVAGFALAGLVFGYGHSPYGRQLVVVLGNLLYVGTLLISVELGRAYLVAAFRQGNQLLALVTPALLFAFISLPLAKFGAVADPPSFLRFLGATYLPAFSESLLASLLVFLGGPLASIAYRGIPIAFEWLSPLLPSTPWTTTAFLGTLLPAFGLIVIRNQVMPLLYGGDTSSREDDQISTPWIMVAVFAVTLIWFNTGLLGYQPTLVSGVSMAPALNVGDVVVTKDVAPEDVAVGDIVRFRQRDSYIIHRVIDVERVDQRVYLVTKGDANNVEDPPITEAALDGKVIATIPKVGWVSIAIRNGFSLGR